MTMTQRRKISQSLQAKVLTDSRRRCCICFALSGDDTEKRGQIAHLDRDPSNNDGDNLAYLCIDHHDQYDSRTSQSKGLQQSEVKIYRDELYQFNNHRRERCLSTLERELGQSKNENAPARSGMGFLPYNSNLFVGRDQELRELATLLSSSCQDTDVVTLCGPPGTGKTRLAVEVAHELTTAYPDGCLFADISEATDVGGIARTVAAALGIPLTGKETPTQAIAFVLSYRAPLLLVIDNCEQVIEFTKETIEFWHEQAPHIQFLLTSRRVLGLPDEREFWVEPLAVPPSSDSRLVMSDVDLLDIDSVRLFVDRARRIDREFVLGEDNADAVAELCITLDGIPLAIELAAGRTRIMTPAEILTNLRGDIGILRSSQPTRSDRHKTLTSAIDWSYQLLTPAQQDVLRQLAIFRSGFFLDAAQEVVSLPSRGKTLRIADMIQELCECSLLVSSPTRLGRRFRLLVPIREYVQGNAAECTDREDDSLRRRFCSYYLTYAECWGEGVHSCNACDALDRLEYEVGNILAVNSWSVQDRDVEVAARSVLAVDETLGIRGPSWERIPRLQATLGVFDERPSDQKARVELLLGWAYYVVGDLDEALSLGERVLAACPEDSLVRAEAIDLVAQVNSIKGLYSAAIEGFSQALDLLGSDENTVRHRKYLTQVAWAYGEMDEHESALKVYERVEHLARSAGDLIWLAKMLNNLGVLHSNMTSFPEATECLLESRELFTNIGDIRTSANPLGNLGEVLRKEGNYEEAIRCYDEAEKINRYYGNRYWLAANLNNRAMCKRSQGRIRAAISEYRTAEELNESVGNRPWLGKNLNNRGLAHADLEELPEALQCFGQAEEIAREIGRKSSIGYTCGNQGRTLIRLGRVHEGLSLTMKAEAINREVRDLIEVAENVGNRGQALFQLRRYTEAVSVLRESLQMYEQQCPKNLFYRFGFTATLAEAEWANGNKEAALGAADSALALADEAKLTEQHEAKWYVQQLVSIKRLRDQLAGSSWPRQSGVNLPS